MGYSSSDAHIYIYTNICYRSLSMCQYLLLISTRHFRSRANLVDLFIFDNRNLRAMAPSRTPPEPAPLPPHTYRSKFDAYKITDREEDILKGYYTGNTVWDIDTESESEWFTGVTPN